MITETHKPYIYWNYFLSLEDDFEKVSRYIEICSDNNNTYSIELARSMLSSCSEVDVVLKELCKLLSNDFDCTRPNIDKYRKVIVEKIPNFYKEKVYIPRYGRKLNPWINWGKNKNPNWWDGYNKVKHQRTEFFKLAKLKNSLNAMAGLLITIYFYYKYSFIKDGENLQHDSVFMKLKPESKLFFLDDSYYPRHLLLE